jgi:hypothetical protein
LETASQVLSTVAYRIPSLIVLKCPAVLGDFPLA